MAEKGKLQSSTLFKQIGVDVDFVANNASKTNDKMNDMYWNKMNGKREGRGGEIENVKLPKNLSMIRNYDVGVDHAAVQSLNGGSIAHHAAAPSYGQPQMSQMPQMQQTGGEAPVFAAPGTPAQVAFDHAMLAQLKAELMAYTDAKINTLAGMMQQFANQTDATLADLKRAADDAAVNARSSQAANGSARKPAADAANPADDTPAAAKMRQQNSINPADVAISKMFNFSHSGGNGKFQR